ncbi:MAG TPA: ABC transporter substrate-binding protein [Candidatus Baltobacteraceae bacterium]|nr:ABC transporter substrate-binding protein [Candidatus Baltobacteraceae bacterium]
MSGRFERFVVLCMVLGFGVMPAARGATVRVASDISGAPFEYYPPNSHRPVGFDVDLLHAMFAKIGSPVAIVNHQFDDLLAAVRRGKFDAAMSAISDTRSRENQVNFLDYFIAGGGIVVPAGNPQHIFGIDALCGYSVSVENGTSYQGDLQRQSSACQAIGLGSIRIATFATDDEAFQAFLDGKTQTYVADYPVGEFRARSANDGKAIEVVGKQFDVVPYGIAVSKQNAGLMSTLQHALMAVVADGTYDMLLKKWGLMRGGLRVAPINAGKRF